MRSASSHPGLAFPKGVKRSTLKRREKQTEAEYKAEVRRRLFALRSRCEYCGETQAETTARFLRNGWAAPSEHVMHEAVMRSQTRGRPLSERFNLDVCKRSCPSCHLERGHHQAVAKGRRS